MTSSIFDYVAIRSIVDLTSLTFPKSENMGILFINRRGDNGDGTTRNDDRSRRGW